MTGKIIHVIGVIIINTLNLGTMHACSLQKKTEQDAAVALPQIIQPGMHSKR